MGASFGRVALNCRVTRSAASAATRYSATGVAEAEPPGDAKNLAGLGMAPSSQGLEPPGNPGRFTSLPDILRVTSVRSVERIATERRVTGASRPVRVRKLPRQVDRLAAT